MMGALTEQQPSLLFLFAITNLYLYYFGLSKWFQELSAINLRLIAQHAYMYTSTYLVQYTAISQFSNHSSQLSMFAQRIDFHSFGFNWNQFTTININNINVFPSLFPLIKWSMIAERIPRIDFYSSGFDLTDVACT